MIVHRRLPSFPHWPSIACGIVIGILAVFLLKPSSKVEEASASKVVSPSSPSVLRQKVEASQKRTGQLSVTSTPPRADVFLDDQKVGQTPITMNKVPRDKSFMLRVEKPGYTTWSSSVDLGRKSKTIYQPILSKK